MKDKSFTLIELLVVISVLSLLILIIFSGMRGTTDRARIAKVLQYQASLHRNLGADIAGWWQFDESLNDISGYENHGTWEGSGSLDYADGIPGTQGYALDLDGGSVRPAIELTQTVELSEEFTISYWFKTRRSNTWRIINNNVTYNHSAWHTNAETITLNSPRISIGLSQSFLTDEWEYIVITRNKNNLVEIYRRGEIVGDNNWDGSLKVNRIGGRAGNTSWDAYDGLIDDVRIYNRALTSKEVQRIYAETRDKYLAVNNHEEQ